MSTLLSKISSSASSLYSRGAPSPSPTPASLPSHRTTLLGQPAFQNPWPSARAATWAETLLSGNPSPLGLFPADLSRSPHARKIRVVQPDWGAGYLASHGLEANHRRGECVVGTWLGHASVHLSMPVAVSSASSTSTPASVGPAPNLGKDSVHFLFDPVFSQRVGPSAYVGLARFLPSPCQAKDLPGCDVVCISHNHFDHLDLPSVRQILESWPEALWFVPLGNKAWFVEVGVSAAKVVESDWWEEAELLPGLGKGKGAGGLRLAVEAKAGLLSRTSTRSTTSSSSTKDLPPTKFRITCAPAQHGSGRAGTDANRTLWSGWVIQRLVLSSSSESESSSSPSTNKPITTPPSTTTPSQQDPYTPSGTIYHAGDTGLRPTPTTTLPADICPVFSQLSTKFPDISLSFLPIWRGASLGFLSYLGLNLNQDLVANAHHASPRDALHIHRMVRSKVSMAVHWGTFVGGWNEVYETEIALGKGRDGVNGGADGLGQLPGDADGNAEEQGKKGRVGDLEQEGDWETRMGIVDLGASVAVVV